MKVALISFTTYSKHLNYGALLHGYALQRYLRRKGIDSEIIDYIPKQLEGYSLKCPILNARFLWRRPVLMIRYFVRWSVSFFANIRKCRKFHDFLSVQMTVTSQRYRESDLLRGALGSEKYDAFVCESDVIWKRRENVSLDRGFFLDFPAADIARKIAYAPSLASKPFGKEDSELVKEYLSSFYAISSRERVGAEYLSKLTERKVDWFIDPTLLLNAADYAEIAVNPGERGYILLYTCMKFNANMVKEARRYAERRGKKLIEVGNYGINRYIFGHKVVDDAGIEEWLGLFMNADEVICNSFHGICFSIIFEKQFYAFSRARDDFRFENICDALGLKERLLSKDGVIPDRGSEIDFNSVSGNLKKLQARAEAFLAEVFSFEKRS